MKLSIISIPLLLLSMSFWPATLAFTPMYRGDARLFLDSADMKEWDSLLKTGVFHGVTSNPSLLERCHQPCTVSNLRELAARALSTCNEFVCQSWGSTVDELYENAFAISSCDRDRVAIKLPITKMGVEATHRLHQSGVNVCLTACFNRQQALVAAGVGAKYLAPHLDKMTRGGRDGMTECKEIMKMMKGLNADTRIMLASIRNTPCMSELAAAGFNTFAMPAFVAEQLFVDDLTEGRAQEFHEAAMRGSVPQHQNGAANANGRAFHIPIPANGYEVYTNGALQVEKHHLSV